MVEATTDTNFVQPIEFIQPPKPTSFDFETTCQNLKQHIEDLFLPLICTGLGPAESKKYFYGVWEPYWEQQFVPVIGRVCTDTLALNPPTLKKSVLVPIFTPVHAHVAHLILHGLGVGERC